MCYYLGLVKTLIFHEPNRSVCKVTRFANRNRTVGKGPYTSLTTWLETREEQDSITVDFEPTDLQVNLCIEIIVRAYFPCS